MVPWLDGRDALADSLPRRGRLGAFPTLVVARLAGCGHADLLRDVQDLLSQGRRVPLYSLHASVVPSSSGRRGLDM